MSIKPERYRERIRALERDLENAKRFEGLSFDDLRAEIEAAESKAQKHQAKAEVLIRRAQGLKWLRDQKREAEKMAKEANMGGPLGNHWKYNGPGGAKRLRRDLGDPA
jgi:uncharacterized membrane protein YqiK